ncbi:unnamed protein product [Prorocentrum cordatum]|uniref:Uncharacterized protein n=1 Tax=Prorocentrum cordatum TaxID=2364126 RepID=A0ABN9TI96_9DINO|nr:unnamed protein product [Polarella glacialis]
MERGLAGRIANVSGIRDALQGVVSVALSGVALKDGEGIGSERPTEVSPRAALLAALPSEAGSSVLMSG